VQPYSAFSLRAPEGAWRPKKHPFNSRRRLPRRLPRGRGDQPSAGRLVRRVARGRSSKANANVCVCTCVCVAACPSRSRRRTSAVCRPGRHGRTGALRRTTDLYQPAGGRVLSRWVTGDAGNRRRIANRSPGRTLSPDRKPSIVHCRRIVHRRTRYTWIGPVRRMPPSRWFRSHSVPWGSARCDANPRYGGLAHTGGRQVDRWRQKTTSVAGPRRRAR
jgi:hypothetical protein